MIMDVTREREELKSLYNNSGIDNKYYFYYDESGNIRKLHIDKNNFNVEICDYFVLGGLVFSEKPEEQVIIREKFQKYISLPNEELKCNYICTKSKNFLDVLKQEKLNKFLDFCLEQNFIIHYEVLNFLYWSIVDVIDSINVEIGVNDKNVLDNIKNLLYLVCKENYKQLASFFSQYNYPNLKENTKSDFLKGIISFTKSSKTLSCSEKTNLLQFLENGFASDFVFITNNPNNILLDNFFNFYVDGIGKFINSFHVFDEENEIQNIIKSYDLKIIENNSVFDNYVFKNSKDDFYLQVSDVIVGLIRKFRKYLFSKSSEEIENDFYDMCKIQRNNLISLLMIIKRSEQENTFFLHDIDSVSEHDKLADLINFYRAL